MQEWAHGTSLERRAAAAALCEPALLTTPGRVGEALAALAEATPGIAESRAEERRSEEFRALRKGTRSAFIPGGLPSTTVFAWVGVSENVFVPAWCRREWVEIWNDGNGDGIDDAVAFGPWRVVRGTGQYVRVAGSGRSGHEGLARVWYARLVGFLTHP